MHCIHFGRGRELGGPAGGGSQSQVGLGERCLSLDLLPSCYEQPRAEIRCWCWLLVGQRLVSIFFSFVSFFFSLFVHMTHQRPSSWRLVNALEMFPRMSLPLFDLHHSLTSPSAFITCRYCR